MGRVDSTNNWARFFLIPPDKPLHLGLRLGTQTHRYFNNKMIQNGQN